MDGATDIICITTHFNSQTDFTNHIAGTRTNNCTADYLSTVSVKNQLSCTLTATIGYSTAGSSPREYRFSDFYPVFFRLIFCHAYPCNFRIGISHPRDNTCIKIRLMTGTIFSSHMGFMYSFMRQHRLTHNITYGKNMRYISTHLLIYINKPAFCNGHSGVFCAYQLAIGCTTGCNQNQIIALRLCRSFSAFKCHINTIFFSFNSCGFGIQHNIIKTMFVFLLPDSDHITVSTLHQTIHHFYHIQTCAQCAVHCTHFQTNNTAADYQHFFRHKFQCQSAC